MRAESPYPAGVSSTIMEVALYVKTNGESSMPSQARTKIALFTGAATVALAAGVGGVLWSNTTTAAPLATPTSSVVPAPPSPTPDPAPATDGNVPSAPGGCIPHINC